MEQYQLPILPFGHPNEQEIKFEGARSVGQYGTVTD
jgi:hypothetical protein